MSHKLFWIYDRKVGVAAMCNGSTGAAAGCRLHRERARGAPRRTSTQSIPGTYYFTFFLCIRRWLDRSVLYSRYYTHIDAPSLGAHGHRATWESHSPRRALFHVCARQVLTLHQRRRSSHCCYQRAAAHSVEAPLDAASRHFFSGNWLCVRVCNWANALISIALSDECLIARSGRGSVDARHLKTG